MVRLRLNLGPSHSFVKNSDFREYTRAVSALNPNRAEAVAVLADPQRRELYRLASEQEISRDDAAAALGLPRSTAAMHLERLADAGLLAVTHVRRSGRSGPGAGRPAKLYRAASADVAASIPERHYELVGDLLTGVIGMYVFARNLRLLPKLQLGPYRFALVRNDQASPLIQSAV